MKRTPLILGCLGLALVGALSGCAGPVHGRGYSYYGYSPSYSRYDDYYGYGPRWGYSDRRARPFPGGSRPGFAPRPGRPYPHGRPGWGAGPRPPGPGVGRPAGGNGPGGGGGPAGGPGGPGR